MFKEITRINGHKEDKAFLINTDDIAFVKELHQEPTRLYNEDGDLVSETQPSEKLYELVLVLKNGYHLALVINETTYAEIVKDLVK